MKTCEVFPVVLFLVGCTTCQPVVISSSYSGESTFDLSSDLHSTVPSIDEKNTTNSSESLSGDGVARGPKFNPEKVFEKVKNKLKEGAGNGVQAGGGHFRHRYRHKKTANGQSSYDTSTVLWIVFGTIGGSVLIIALYYGFRVYNGSDKQATDA